MARTDFSEGNCRGKEREHRFNLDIIPGLAKMDDEELSEVGKNANDCGDCPLKPECGQKALISREGNRIVITVGPVPK